MRKLSLLTLGLLATLGATGTANAREYRYYRHSRPARVVVREYTPTYNHAYYVWDPYLGEYVPYDPYGYQPYQTRTYIRYGDGGYYRHRDHDRHWEHRHR